MPTRSGTTYHKTFKCVDCLEFYQMINKNKCSYCTVNKPPSYIKRQNMIKAAYELAKKMTIKEEDRKMKFIKMISRKKNDNMLFASFKSLDEDNSGEMTYLLAKDALSLYLEHPTVLRGHLVASRVFDWWNIKSIFFIIFNLTQTDIKPNEMFAYLTSFCVVGAMVLCFLLSKYQVVH